MTGNKKGGSLIVIVVLAVCIVLGLALCLFLGISQKAGKLEQSKTQEQEQSTQMQQSMVEATELQMDFEDFAVGEEKTLEPEPETETETDAETAAEAAESEETSEYLCSYSSERIMTEEDVEALKAGVYEGLPADKSIIQMVINEMYARYGYQFSNEEILNYFEQKTWYSEITERTDDMDGIYQQMTDIEKDNIDFLRTIEE